jgi:catechol 2,3-dioxygenase-like lactoylglutathione lyase family enzyme
MLGHLGVNVPDLLAARRYYGALLPLVDFEPFFDAADEFSYRPADGKPGTYLFFYPATQPGSIRRSERACSTWRSACRAGHRCAPCTTTSPRSGPP